MSSSGGKTTGALARLRHDLRTPINHILGYSELVREELEDGGVAAGGEDLKKISRAAERLLEMINEHLSDHNLPVLLGGAEEADARDTEPKEEDAAREATRREANETLARFTGHVLVVDDDAENRDTLSRRLRKQGHTAEEAADGHAALEALGKAEFDLVLLDVMMPGLDGYGVLDAIKSDERLRHVPVIMISALDELGSVVRCIERGAEDYLGKPFEPTLLRARIEACLEKKGLRDQERQYLKTIEETQRRLQGELEEAANYARSILPEPADTPMRIRWEFVPSTELGGDSFGYHWVDDDHFACYLLDVCGHGVGAALLSVAAINVIRSGSLSETDFRSPGKVIASLNDAFPMERHNNMYFTIWYGVYQRSTRVLRHASGGHPPSFLLGADDAAPHELRCPGMVVGAMEGMEFDEDSVEVPPGARLVLFSDGAYEIKTPDGAMLEWERFVGFVADNRQDPELPARVRDAIRSLHGEGPLEDDFSMVAIDFDSQ